MAKRLPAAILIACALTLLAAACGGDDGEKGPATTTQPLETPTLAASLQTPTDQTGGLGEFRSFASQIEQAIVDGDAQFFLDRAVLEEVRCTGEQDDLGLGGPCAGRPAGTVSGIPGGVWKGDTGAIFTPAEYEQALQRYFDGALTAQTDGYGSGALALFVLARGEREGQEVFYAITTSIVDEYPSTGAPIDMPLRETHAFRFMYESGGWSFTGETVAFASAADDWLSGQCTDCYAEWERWTGTPTGLQDPAESAATAIAAASGFATPEQAIEAYAEEWRPPFLGDCDALAEPQPGSCLATAREVGQSEATYRPCVPGTDACLIVTFVRGADGRWTLSRVESGGPGPAQQLVP